jgi:hypothetical protein
METALVGYNAFYDRKDKTTLPDEITNLTWSRFFDGYEPLQSATVSGAPIAASVSRY